MPKYTPTQHNLNNNNKIKSQKNYYFQKSEGYLKD
jgi:hypothetical protein